MLYNQKTYKLINLINGDEILLDGKNGNNEPRNWENSDYTIKRDVKTLATIKKASNNLEFTGNSAFFLRNCYNAYGIEARVKMVEYRVNTSNDFLEQFDISEMDFSNYEDHGTFIKVNFNSGTLASLIKGRQNDKFEVSRTTSVTGDILPELNYTSFNIVNRTIFLESKLLTNQFDRDSFIFRMRRRQDYRYGWFAVPLEIDFESDDSIDNVANNSFLFTSGQEHLGSILIDPIANNRFQLFYYNSDADKKLNIDITYSSHMSLVDNDDLENRHLSLRLVKFTGGTNPTFSFPAFSPSLVQTGNRFPDFDDFINLGNANSVLDGVTQLVSFSANLDIDLQTGDSLGIFIFAGGLFDGGLFSDANCSFNMKNTNCQVVVKEDSLRNDIDRNTLCLFNKDVGKRLMSIINNNENSYYSEYFNTSEFKYTALTSGKLLRGFKETSLTVSLKQFLENSRIYNMAYNIEDVTGEEVLVHEHISYFFRNEIIIKIDEQVSNVVRKPATEFFYNNIISGYEKPSGDNLYEEVNGLNEYNTTNEYAIPSITKVQKDYDLSSPFRADSEGKELSVRKHKFLFPNEDYRTDNSVFNLDLKPIGNDIYAERTWQDDFIAAPKNVFDPDTVTGLRITPYRILERHLPFLKSSLYKYPTDSIIYTSTRGNSNLITQKAGEEEKAENGNILIGSINGQLFKAEWVTFDYKVSFDLMKLINGFTYVDGRRIPNIYFPIQYINEFNEQEIGYLFELKPNKEGKWKMLKVN